MGLVAGSASLTANPDGTITAGGTGIAAAIAAAWIANDPNWGNPTWVKAQLENQQFGPTWVAEVFAGYQVPISNGIAAALVTALTTDAVVTVPVTANELASGVPAAPMNLTGGIS